MIYVIIGFDSVANPVEVFYNIIDGETIFEDGDFVVNLTTEDMEPLKESVTASFFR
jgi:hypothetical protein